MDILRAGVGFQGHKKSTTLEGILKIAAEDAVCAVLYVVVLLALYKFTHKYAGIVLVLCCALAGQFLFV